ncbi:hypothetical protein [Aneurinibacillus migulanus]|uniref:hypothetical protein n=1 Tax=Aneurinibacillus migulanus TaxID=47500 RepID=UPI000A716D27|nr:hypothetical protein [Aneurinibacillus migulanus]
MEGIRCTRRRVPSSFSRKEEIRPLCGAKAGPAKHLGLSLFVSTRMFCGPAWLGQKAAFYASGWETNRRPFEARCGGYPL